VVLRCVKADLHVHTYLSPCTGPDMSPLGVVREARRRGIDLIGICDHNSAENVPALKKAGKQHGVMVLGGIEVTSSEEAHILVFFDDAGDLLRFQDLIYEHLSGTNDESTFGRQVIADDEDRVQGFCDRFLINATSLTAERIAGAAQEAKRECLVIAAHVDREVYGIIGQLGFIPPRLKLDAVEVSGHITLAAARERFPDCKKYPLIIGSDAHHLEEIGKRCMRFFMKDGSIAEIKRALNGKDGRKADC